MTDAIKTMQLYTAVDRIHADLAAEGYGRDDALDPSVLSRYDQLHYFGTDAVEEAIGACGLGPGARVLDIGSGFGGPARYMARVSGARVDAVELQADMNETATDLTRRTDLADLVRHVQGDILQTPLQPDSYDAAVSWLALYHIPDRAPLFPRLYRAMKPGARLFVEDLYCRAPLTPEEAAAMSAMLYANTLPTREDYVAEVTAGGFAEVAFADMTPAWAAFTRDRLETFRAGRDECLARHGAGTCDALGAFYETIAGLLARGHVGGVRLTATRA